MPHRCRCSLILPLRIVRTEKEAELLADPMRREILRLLSAEPMTESELSKVLDLSPPAVGHHLLALGKQNFVKVERTDTEKHGIVRKFYRSDALVFLLDPMNIPIRLKRYFGPADIERARGLMASMMLLNRDNMEVSVSSMNRLCGSFCHVLIEVAKERAENGSGEDPEKLITGLYRDAIRRLVSSDTQIFRRLPVAG